MLYQFGRSCACRGNPLWLPVLVIMLRAPTRDAPTFGPPTKLIQAQAEDDFQNTYPPSLEGDDDDLQSTYPLSLEGDDDLQSTYPLSLEGEGWGEGERGQHKGEE